VNVQQTQVVRYIFEESEMFYCVSEGKDVVFTRNEYNAKGYYNRIINLTENF
jgi:hypothetical protein